MQEDYKLGIEKFKEKDYKAAYVAFKKALIGNDIHDEDFYIIYGKVARNISLHLDSKTIFEMGLNLFPQSANLMSELGVSYFHLQDLSQSLQMLSNALAVEPDNPYRYSSRAYIKGNMGDLDGAIQDYEEALQLDPKDEITYNNLGLLYEKKGFQKEAKTNFDKSDEILEEKGQGPNINKWKEKELDNKKEHNNKGLEGDMKKEKLTTKGYFSTVKAIFTNKSERKEFGEFIKKGLGRKKN